jgi:hypothetical protein
MSSVPQNVIKHKVGLLNLAAELGKVSRACKNLFSIFWAQRSHGNWPNTYLDFVQSSGITKRIDKAIQ